MPAIFEDHVFFGDRAGLLYKMDAFSGDIQWSYEVGTQVTGQPLVSHGAPKSSKGSLWLASMAHFINLIKELY